MKIKGSNVTTRKKILISHIFKTHVPWLSRKFYIHRFRYKRSGIVNSMNIEFDQRPQDWGLAVEGEKRARHDVSCLALFSFYLDHSSIQDLITLIAFLSILIRVTGF